MLKLLAILAAVSDARCPAPTQEELDEFEQRCRSAHLTELGHLLFTAATRQHAKVAEKVLTERLHEDQ
jgi:hypothetical protein